MSRLASARCGESRGQRRPSVQAPPSSTGVLEPDLEASVPFRLDPQRALHIDFHGQLIAALELVSPRNKDRPSAREQYAGRAGW